MSSASTIAEIEGFKALLAHAGEVLSFRNGSVTVLVNRNPFEKKDDPRRVDLNANDNSEIQLFDREAVNNAVGQYLANTVSTPAVGESFQDQFGHFHRIESFKRLGPTVRCYCKVTDAA